MKLTYEIELPDNVYVKNGSDEFAVYFQDQIMRMLRDRIDYSRIAARHIRCEWVENNQSPD